jgi:hypothetical protein
MPIYFRYQKIGLEGMKTNSVIENVRNKGASSAQTHIWPDFALETVTGKQFANQTSEHGEHLAGAGSKIL